MISKFKFGIKSLKTIIKYFDLYGQNVNLYVNKEPKFHSSCSGIASIGIIFLMIYVLTGILTSWMNYERLNVITSSMSWSVSQLLKVNQKQEYELNYNNYDVYFMVRAFLPNGTSLFNDQLKKYVTYSYSYKNVNQQTLQLNYEFCNMQHYDIFLGLDEQTISMDQNITNKNRICINNPVMMGLFPDTKLQIIHQPEIHFTISQCANSTANGNFCASQNEIDKMVQYMNIQATIPTTLYDFQNVNKPQRNFYDFKLIDLDKSMTKNYKNYLIPTLLYTDHGLLNDDYQLEERCSIFYECRYS